MSSICYYVRANQSIIEALGADPSAILEDHIDQPYVEVIDIDLAFEGLSWLASPLKRAEAAYLARLLSDRDWPESAIDARRAEIDIIPVDDALGSHRRLVGTACRCIRGRSGWRDLR